MGDAERDDQHDEHGCEGENRLTLALLVQERVDDRVANLSRADRAHTRYELIVEVVKQNCHLEQAYLQDGLAWEVSHDERIDQHHEHLIVQVKLANFGLRVRAV